MDKLRNIIVNNWQLKLLSLLLSLLLWIFIVFEKSSEVNFQIPVIISNLPKNKLIVKKTADNIIVYVRGPRALLAGMGKIKPYRINLTNVKDGIFQIRVMPEDLNLPAGVEVVKIIPSSIEVVIDDIYERKVRIKVRTKGLLPPGYELKNIELTPSEVRVKGAKSQIEKLRVLYTEAIDISSVTSDRSFDVPLNIDGLTITEITSRMVHVTLTVETKKILKEFVGVPLIVVGNKKYFLKEKLVNIKAYGPQIILGKMKPEDIKAYINISNLRKGRRRVQVNVDLPAKVSLVGLKPAFVEVTVH